MLREPPAKIIEAMGDIPKENYTEVPDPFPITGEAQKPRFVVNKTALPHGANSTSAVLYKAWDRRMDRPVMLKFPPFNYAINSQDTEEDKNWKREQWESLIKEAKTLAKAELPQQVVRVFDCFTTKTPVGEIPVIVMDRINGKSIDQEIHEGKTFNQDETQAITAICANTIDTLAKRGIISADFKPSNIIRTPEGVQKIDFGLANLVVDWKNNRGGTIGYAPPENLIGSSLTIPTLAGEVFSLGATIHFMIRGKNPFNWYDSDTPMKIRDRNIDATPFPLSTDAAVVKRIGGNKKAEAIDLVLKTAMAKDPENRYGTASQLSQALADAMKTKQ